MRARLLSFCLFISFSLSAQNTLNAVYTKTIDLEPGEQDIGEFAFDMDSNLVIMSSFYSWTTNTWGVTTSVWDSTGHVLSKRTFCDTVFGYLSIMKAIEVDHRVIYGIGYSIQRFDTINDLDLYFVKYNNVGDTLFTRIYRDTGSVLGIDIIQIKPNLFAVVCQSTPDYLNPVVMRTKLLLMDSLGNTLKEVYGPAAQYYSSFLCHDPSRKEYYTVGIYPDDPVNFTGYYSFMHVFDDSTLNLKFTTNLAPIGNKVQAAAFYEGSLYFAIAEEITIPPYVNSGTQLLVYKCRRKDQSFVVLGSYRVTPKDTTGISAFSNLVFDGDRFMFAGFNSYTRLSMYFSDTLMNGVCRAEIPDSISKIRYTTTTLTRKKQLVSTGYTFDGVAPGPSKVVTWVSASMNYQDYLRDSCRNINVGVSGYDSETKMFVFPNPCTSYIRVNTNSMQNAGNITIIDVLGRTIKRFECGGHTEIELETDDLPPGIFTIVLTNGREYRYCKVLKE